MKGIKTKDCTDKIKSMEKKTLYLKGEERDNARQKYLKLLKSCKKECGLEEPVYYKRR